MTKTLHYSDQPARRLTLAQKGDFILHLQGQTKPTQRQRQSAQHFVKAWCQSLCFDFLVMHIAAMRDKCDDVWPLRFEG